MANLKNKKIIYTFDTWEDYDDLMQHLEDEGVTWFRGQKPTDEWQRLKEDMGYNAESLTIFLRNGKLTHACVECANLLQYVDYEKVLWKKREEKDKKIIYTFDTSEDYDDLMQHLEDEGVTWLNGEKPTEWQGLKGKCGGNANQMAVELAEGTIIYATKDWFLKCSPDNNYEEVHWKKRKKKDISLADFLGWEEGSTYGSNNDLYTIKNGLLYKRTESSSYWVQNYTIQINRYESLRKLEKYEPKYYAKIKGWELIPSAYYFVWSKKWRTLALGNVHAITLNKDTVDYYMTKEEWKKRGINEDNAEFFKEQ